jgi:UDP-N-acetylglucosamine 2-epimerase (non-hydrolysing)
MQPWTFPGHCPDSTLFDEVIRERKPDWVLVQGDTTTAMVASLVAYYHQIRVGHIEAGLRTDDKYQPFPEEVNRRVVDVLADLYFVPTALSCENLLREGIPGDKILITGNTVIDALLKTARKVQNRPLDALIGNAAGKRLVLVTAHRRENFGAPLERICQALQEIANHYPDIQIVYPVHPNPNVLGPVHSRLGNIPNIKLIAPVNYDDMVNLMSQAYFILTDSGGLQEEAPSLHKPVLVLREVTERPEVVALGAAKLVGTDPDRILREATRLLMDGRAYQEMASVENPYGNGRASEKIVQALREARPL